MTISMASFDSKKKFGISLTHQSFKNFDTSNNLGV